MWEDFEEDGKQALAKAKVTTNILDAAEAAKFNAASSTVVDRWIKEARANGIDGAALVQKARAAVAAAN